MTVQSRYIYVAGRLAIVDERWPAEGDFETFSEAGHIWNEETGKYEVPRGAQKKGLQTVGAAAYAEHPTTEVLSFAYSIPWIDANGALAREKYLWIPGYAPPVWLFEYLAAGGIMEAHNSFFEFVIWTLCCIRLYGWPPIDLHSLRCTMATARSNCLPGGLEMLSEVLHLEKPKDERGKKALDVLSVPRNPTKAKPWRRVTPEMDPATFQVLTEYNLTDIDAERGVAEATVPMSPAELEFWLIDQEINWRGIGVDRKAVHDCIAVLDQAHARYGDECRQITGGLNPTQLDALKSWLSFRGCTMTTMDEEAITVELERMPPHPPGGMNPCRRVLEIRQLLGSASVKKLFSMENMCSSDDRLRNLIIHHGTRTGRPTGGGPQPLNLPRGGPDLWWCDACGRPFGKHHIEICPWCRQASAPFNSKCEWPLPPAKNFTIAPGYDIGPDFILEVMATRSLQAVEYYFGDAVLCISGCIRSLFVAGPGNELIASDYSAIEAVVLACLAGEQWRIDAFRENKPMYLVGASKITGKSLEFYEEYKATHGHHHPDRQDIGKVSELAGGFQGWIGSYRAFGSTASDEEIKQMILAWRKASPAIVEFWGGQFRGAPWDDNARQEYYGVEGHFILAFLYPGQVFTFRGLQFYTRDYPSTGRAVIIRLPSGRELTYHGVRLAQSRRPYARAGEYTISYWTYNSNPKYGQAGWVLMDTYGGRLTENIVQAVSHCLLRFAITNLRAIGYQTVLHVYDEIVAEIRKGTGDLEMFEAVMATLPPWAEGWPVRAAGGWIGRRYRKE